MHADRFTGRPATGLGTKTESNFCTKVGKDDGGDTKFYGYCESFRFHMFRETYLQTLGFFLLMPFIMSTMKTAHVSILNDLNPRKDNYFWQSIRYFIIYTPRQRYAILYRSSRRFSPFPLLIVFHSDAQGIISHAFQGINMHHSTRNIQKFR